MADRTFEHLRDLPDGSLSRAEVGVLLDEIQRLHSVLDKATATTWHNAAREALYGTKEGDDG